MSDGEQDKTVRQSSGQDPDSDLVALAQAELPYVDTAYSRLMLRYERLIFQLCRRLLDRPADAEEVVQEVMLKVFHHLVSFEGRSKFKTWLLQIVRRECYSYYQKHKNSLSDANVDDYLATGEGGEFLSTAEQQRVESELHVEKILSALEMEERQILSLRFIAELELSEIAEVLELKLSATKMRLYRAIEKAKSIAEKV